MNTRDRSGIKNHHTPIVASNKYITILFFSQVTFHLEYYILCTSDLISFISDEIFNTNLMMNKERKKINNKSKTIEIVVSKTRPMLTLRMESRKKIAIPNTIKRYFDI